MTAKNRFVLSLVANMITMLPLLAFSFPLEEDVAVFTDTCGIGFIHPQSGELQHYYMKDDRHEPPYSFVIAPDNAAIFGIGLHRSLGTVIYKITEQTEEVFVTDGIIADAVGIDMDENGDLVVVTGASAALLRIDLLTRAITQISQGVYLNSLNDVAVEPGGSALVVGSENIVRVFPNGNQEVLSDALDATFADRTDAGGESIELSPTGEIYIADGIGIYRVDAYSGMQFCVTGDCRDWYSGFLTDPYDVALFSNGDYGIAESWAELIVRVDRLSLAERVIGSEPGLCWGVDQIEIAKSPVRVDLALQPVHRFWSDTYKAHFYTISDQEKDYIIAVYPDYEWRYEGAAYCASDDVQTLPSSAAAVYRFWSDTYGAHFFTISREERDFVIATYPPTVWNYEGIAFLAFAFQAEQTLPVFRFWSDLYQAHFYTMNSVERDYILNTYPATVWRYEGVAWYAYPTGMCE